MNLICEVYPRSEGLQAGGKGRYMKYAVADFILSDILRAFVSSWQQSQLSSESPEPLPRLPYGMTFL